MTKEIKPTPRPTPEELDNVQITPEMVASWAAHDRLEEAKARQQRRQEHELEAIERGLIADGVAPEDAKTVAPDVREERIRTDATERARAHEQSAARRIRQAF